MWWCGGAGGDGRAAGQQRRGDLLDDRDHVRVVRVEALGDRRPLRPPLDGEAEHLAPGVVQEAARVGPVVGGARGGIEPDGVFHAVPPAVGGGDGVAHGGAQSDRLGQITGRDEFPVLRRVRLGRVVGGGAVRNAALAVVGGVVEVHRRVGGLIVVVAPVVEDVLAEGVDVDEVGYRPVPVEQPGDVGGLRFGCGAGSEVDLLTRVGGGPHGRVRAELGGVVPEEVVVAVEVDTGATPPAGGAGRLPGVGGPAVLAPHRVDGHGVVPAVRIGLWGDDHVEVVHDLPHLGCADAGAALGDAGAVPVGVGEQPDEVDQDVGAAPFAGVHPAEQVDPGARRRTGVNAQGRTGPPLPRPVGQGNQLA